MRENNMHRSWSLHDIFYLLALAPLVALALFAAAPTSRGEYPSRKIVVFEEHFVNERARAALLKKHGALKVKDLPFVRGVAVLLPDAASERSLLVHSGVKRVDEDVVVSIFSHSSIQPAQVLPWGIDRVDAELVFAAGNAADPVKVGVIDTGVAKDHPDLKANLKGGVNTISPRKSWNDDNGHGSHVAGIVGALNNTIGVVGVGPAVDLYAIKVLGANGSGFLSDVIEGIQWAAANGMEVVNMSLGTSSDIPSFRDAVVAAHNAGVVLVAAAGNSGGAVSFPAAYPEVIAVSATDQDNALASFSSRGPEVDLAAPGVSVYSTYKGSGYATLSGTSMAAPHVAGAAALLLNTAPGLYDTNANGKWDPVEVQQKLQEKAVDLGTVGFDEWYGWGLVNAWNAVQ